MRFAPRSRAICASLNFSEALTCEHFLQMRLAALLERNISLHFRHFRSPGSWGKGRVDIACGSFSEEVEEGWVTGFESNRVN